MARKAGYDMYDVKDFWLSGRQKSRKSIRDTLERQGDFVNVKLWGHEIGKVDFRNKELMLSDAGYQTNTTKARLNKLLDYKGQIRQKKYQWYLNNKKWEGSDFFRFD